MKQTSSTTPNARRWLTASALAIVLVGVITYFNLEPQTQFVYGAQTCNCFGFYSGTCVQPLYPCDRGMGCGGSYTCVSDGSQGCGFGCPGDGNCNVCKANGTPVCSWQICMSTAGCAADCLGGGGSTCNTCCNYSGPDKCIKEMCSAPDCCDGESGTPESNGSPLDEKL